MIGTLMEAAGADQRRPTLREATVLVLHGLRYRLGPHRAGSTGGPLLGALRLAVLLLLAYATAGSLTQTGRLLVEVVTDRALDYPTQLIHPLATVVAASALIAVAGGRYTLGLLATLGALAATLTVLHLSLVGVTTTGARHYPPLEFTRYFAMTESTVWPLPLAVLLIIPLIRRPVPGARRPAAWLLSVPIAVVLLPTDYDVTIGLQPGATVVLMAGSLLWVAVDARATIAAGVLLIPLIAAMLALYSVGAWGQPETLGGRWFWTLVVGAAALLTAGTLVIRRQARV
ncbi:hypothetical protein ABNF97_28665 [Plantactinospora sp. B6F1]|uniref:hypothetical protein n=1 Tax=Plantactinospora sp. B6F1 TaxID=3158971 RepID=UPI0032D8C64F